MPSVIGRRPKGVVTLPLSIFSAFRAGKAVRLVKMTPISMKRLDYDSRKCDSLSRQTVEKGFRNAFRGPFSLPVFVFAYPSIAVDIKAPTMAPG
jgi:hypothetical protein